MEAIMNAETMMVRTIEPTERYATDDARYRAIESRDPAADGHFITAVTTTGISCRPGCPSRTPSRATVPFSRHPVEAPATGFPACRRSDPAASAPRDSRLASITAACRLIENAEAPPPNLEELG